MPTTKTLRPAAAPIRLPTLLLAALAAGAAGCRHAEPDTLPLPRRSPKPPVQPAQDFRQAPSRALPPTRSARHVLPNWKPDGHFAPPSLAMGGSLVPVSLVCETADGGDAYYSAGVNRVTARAEQGAVEWLGTRCGVKALDRKTGEVRHYTRQDGLPGDYIDAIAADDEGVYAAVRILSKDGRTVVLCALDPATGRWRSLPPIRTHNPNGEQPSRLVLTPGAVLLAPPFVDRRTGIPAITALDRKTGKVRSLPLPADIAESARPVGVTFFARDAAGSVCLGTSGGLLIGRPDQQPSIAWRRLLKGSLIEAGTVSADGRTIWLLHHENLHIPAGIPVGVPEYGWPKSLTWTLDSLDAKSGKVTTAARQTSLYYPCAVSVGPDKGVWVTWTGGTSDGGFYRWDPAAKKWTSLGLDGRTIAPPAGPVAGGPSGPPATGMRAVVPGFARALSTSNIASARAVPDAAVLPIAIGRGTYGYGIREYDNGSEFRADRWTRDRFPEWLCPDDAPQRSQPGFSTALPDPAQAGWIWFVRDSALRHARAADVSGYPAASGNNDLTSAMDAPTGERYPFEGGVMTGRASVDDLLAGPDGTLLVETPTGMSQFDEDSGWRAMPMAPDSPEPAWGFHADRTAVGGPDRRVIISRGRTLYWFDPTLGFRQSEIAPPETNPTLAGVARDGVWWLRNPLPTAGPKAGEPEIYITPLGPNGRSAAGKPEALSPGLPPGAETAAPDPNGRHAPYQLSACGVTDAGDSGSGGGIGWFVLRLPGEVRRENGVASGDLPRFLVGYDRSRHRWTAPLALDPFLGSEVRPVAGPDGSVYACADSDGRTVKRYVPSTNRWLTLPPVRYAAAATPPPPALPPGMPARLAAQLKRQDVARAMSQIEGGPLQIAGADAKELWAADRRGLWRFDHATGRWTSYPIPPPQNGFAGTSFGFQRSAACTSAAVWVATSDRGLWRFDRRKSTWREQDIPIPLAPAPEPSPHSAAELDPDFVPTPGADRRPGAHLLIGAADAAAVWGTIAAEREPSKLGVFRFDRKRHVFTVYDRRAGVPDGFRSLVADGDGVWLRTFEGAAYRLDSKTGRCTLVADVAQPSPSSISDMFARAEPGAGRRSAGSAALPAERRYGRVSAIAPDPASPDLVYLLLTDIPMRQPDSQQPILYRYRKSSGRLEPMPAPPAGLFRGLPWVAGVGGLYAGADGSEPLRVATSAGIASVDRKTGAWHPAPLPFGAPGYTAERIYRDDSGALWFRGADWAVRTKPDRFAAGAASRPSPAREGT